MATQANRPDWYRITTNAAAQSADVFLYGVVGGYDWENDQALDGAGFVSQINALDVGTINFRINSPGGSVVEGHAIHNALVRHPARVITHIDALAASMASVIAMAGDEVHMADNATFMIHDPWTVVMGDSDDLRKFADVLDMIGEQIIAGYQRHTELSAEAIRAMMAAETWMDADTALAHGFVTHIDGAMQMAALVSSKFSFQNMPDLIRRNSTQDIITMDDQIDPVALKVAVDAQLEELVAENDAQVEAHSLAIAAADQQLAERDATIGALTAEVESLTAQASEATAKLTAEVNAHEDSTARLAALTGGLKLADEAKPSGDAVAAFNDACAEVAGDRKISQVAALKAVMAEQPETYTAYIDAVNYRD